MNRSRRRQIGFAVALVATAAILVGRWLFFDPLVGKQFPFVLFVMSVVAAAWIGGLWPGVLALSLGLVLGISFYTEHDGLVFADHFDVVRITMFLAVGTLVCVLAEMALASDQRLVGRQQQLEAQVRQLAIEQQKRAKIELALDEREERFRMAVESADIGTWELNVLTGERNWSDRTLAIFGLDPQVDVSKLDFAALLHPEDREPFRKAVRAALDPQGDGRYRIDYRACRPDGTIRWVVAKGQAFFQGTGNQRHAVRFIGTVLDITDRKAMEESLHDANRRKDQFLATLAHELRNPLAPIVNTLEIWPLVSDDKSKLDRLREGMARHVRQLMRLTDDLMDVSRISRGTFALQQTRIDLRALVSEVCEDFEPLLGAKGPRLSCSVPESPLVVIGDVVRLTQVLENLLRNAAKFTDATGAIAVSLVRDGERALIRVKDDGVGIPPHLVEEVFELFRQVDPNAAHANAGLGIGLHLVKQIVELHGGQVWARSDGLGQGTEIQIALPVTSAAPPTVERRDPRPAAERQRGARRRVLVVDDLPEVAASLAALLEVIGHDVLVAHDGPSAIEAVLAKQPEVVFVDIAMPAMDGYEVASTLRAGHGLKNLVLVALTGRDQPQDRRRSIDAGFDHHLTKPTTLADIESVLKSSALRN